MKNLAIFDLDNTLINTDSARDWMRYLADTGRVDAESTRKQSEQFHTDYRNGCLDISAFWAFQLAPLARFSREELDKMHAEFTQRYILPNISPMQKMLVESHRAAGDELLVISATDEFVIAPICRLFGIENFIGTKPETDETGAYTGRYVGTPSIREGKITRLLQWLESRCETLQSYGKVYFYSDSQNDLPLMRMVDEAVAVNPDSILKQEAEAKGWPVLNFKEAV